MLVPFSSVEHSGNMPLRRKSVRQDKRGCWRWTRAGLGRLCAMLFLSGALDFYASIGLTIVMSIVSIFGRSL